MFRLYARGSVEERLLMRAPARGGARVPTRSLRLLEDALRWGSADLFSAEKLAEAAAAEEGALCVETRYPDSENL